MTRHVVIVDGNYQGVLSVAAATRIGYHVTFVRSERMSKFYERPDLNDIMRGVHEVLQVEDSTNAELLAGVIGDIHYRRPVDGLLTTHDYCVSALASAAEKAGLRFTSQNAVETARDKGRCREVLQANGLRSTPFAVVKSNHQVLRAAKEIGYPVVIKPLSGVGGILVALVNSDAALEEYLSEAVMVRTQLASHQSLGISDDFIVEKFVAGQMLQVEIAVRDGEIFPLMVSEGKRSPRNPILSLGTNMPAHISEKDRNAVVCYCRRVVEAIGMDLGIFHIELALSNDGPCLIEFNPRLMGSSLPKLFQHVTGSDVFEFMVRLYCGDELDAFSFLPKNFASSRPIASWETKTVRSPLNLDWAEQYRPRLLEFEIAVHAGQKIHALRSMYDFVGFVQVSSSTSEETAADADKIVCEIGKTLGFDAAL